MFDDSRKLHANFIGSQKNEEIVLLPDSKKSVRLSYSGDVDDRIVVNADMLSWVLPKKDREYITHKARLEHRSLVLVQEVATPEKKGSFKDKISVFGWEFTIAEAVLAAFGVVAFVTFLPHILGIGLIAGLVYLFWMYYQNNIVGPVESTMRHNYSTPPYQPQRKYTRAAPTGKNSKTRGIALVAQSILDGDDEPFILAGVSREQFLEDVDTVSLLDQRIAHATAMFDRPDKSFEGQKIAAVNTLLRENAEAMARIELIMDAAEMRGSY